MDDTTPLSAGREGDGWHLSLRRHRLIPLAIGALSGVCVVLAGIQAAEGNIEVMVVLLILGAAFAPAPWWLNRRRADPAYVDTAFGSGLLLPVNPRTWAFILSAFFMGAGFVEFGLALEVRAADEGDRSIGIVLFAVIGGFGVFMWVKTFDALRSRFRPDLGLLLTPESIVVNPDARPLRIPWNAVTAVQAHWVRMSDGDWLEIDDLVRNFLTVQVHQRLVTRKPRPLDVSRLACEPDLALAILRFYLATPDARDELRSVAAAERVASISAGD